MAAMENSRLKLSYFDARGVAETTRYMLAVTKTPYEDFRYGFYFRKALFVFLMCSPDVHETMAMPAQII